MVSESDLIEYESPKAQLGHYVNQLSQCCEDNKLGSFLKTCGSKISENIVTRGQSEMLGEEEEFRTAFTETNFDDRVGAAMESIHRAMVVKPHLPESQTLSL